MHLVTGDFRTCDRACERRPELPLRNDRFHIFLKDLTELRLLLTWGAPVSMVRAAFRGAGFPGFRRDGAKVETMSDARGNGDPGGRSADEAALSARLRNLGEKLDHERASRPSEPDPGARQSADPS